jgi:hypothetical protein
MVFMFYVMSCGVMLVIFLGGAGIKHRARPASAHFTSSSSPAIVGVWPEWPVLPPPACMLDVLDHAMGATHTID